MSNGKRIVVALGGNAISQPDEEGNVAQQFEHSREADKPLADLIEQGYHLVITHGNGPQIGNFLLRNDAGIGLIYPLPMEVAVAHVQGGMGYMIAQTLTNELQCRGHDKIVASIITSILVDADDPSFDAPSKPIGRTMNQVEAHRRKRDQGWAMKEVAPGLFRRVVASPTPKHIMQIETVRRAVEAGEILVVCGGGGIPVVRGEDRSIQGARAVIDKDLASALLAEELNADAMLILTNIDRVSIHFGKPDEQEVERMTLSQARQWMNEGHFPAGSMGPKIQSAINFLAATQKEDARVYIGPLARSADIIAGKTGTTITKN